jgi:predicted RNA-binding protein with RPS1 domain
VIQAKVINVSPADKKIALSIRKLEESSEKEIYRNYLDGRKEATSNLGEILREEMMNLQRQMVPEETDDVLSDEGMEPSARQVEEDQTESNDVTSTKADQSIPAEEEGAPKSGEFVDGDAEDGSTKMAGEAPSGSAT